MVNKFAPSVEQLLTDAIDAAESGHSQVEIKQKFKQAIQSAKDLPDLAVRKQNIRGLAESFRLWKWYELAQEAALLVIRLDQASGEKKDLAEDMIIYGNILSETGNDQRAAQAFSTSLQICEQNSYWKNAASASTNLAMVYANNSRIPEAIQLLDNSLSYLKKVSFPQTEFNTRLAYLQLANYHAVDDLLVIRLAEGLDDLGEQLLTEDIARIKAPLMKAIHQYSQQNSAVDVNTLLRKFSWLS